MSILVKTRDLVTMLKSFFNYYLCGSIINASISFFVIAYLSHQISPDKFVLLGVVTSFLGFVGSVIGFQTRSYVLFVASKETSFNKNDLVNIISSIFWMIASFLTVIGCLALFDIQQFFTSPIIYLVMKCAAAQWLYYLILIIFQSKNLVGHYFITILVSAIISACYILIVSLIGDISWEDRLLGLMLGFLSSPFIILFRYKNLRINVTHFDFLLVMRSLKKSIIYSAPLVPYSLSISSIVFFERFIASENLRVLDAAVFLALAQIILIYGIMAESIYKKCQRSYLQAGNNNELFTAVKLVLFAGVGYIAIGQLLFNLIFPEHIIFNFILFLLMMVSAFFTFIIKIISLVFNFYQINTSLAKYAVLFNVFGLILMNYLSNLYGVLMIPCSIIISNLIVISLLSYKIKRISND